jgi:hypothetical protein
MVGRGSAVQAKKVCGFVGCRGSPKSSPRHGTKKWQGRPPSLSELRKTEKMTNEWQ